MTCWRCGRVEHADWCSDGTPADCDHCGGNPCRWWCLGEDYGPGLRSGIAEWDYGGVLRRVLEPV